MAIPIKIVTLRRLNSTNTNTWDQTFTIDAYNTFVADVANGVGQVEIVATVDSTLPDVVPFVESTGGFSLISEFPFATGMTFGPIYSLPGGRTWNDLIADYQQLVFRYNVRVTGVTEDVLRVIYIDPRDLVDNSRWRFEYGVAIIDFLPGALTGGDFSFTGATIDTIGLEILGIEKTATPIDQAVINDESANGYFDVGNMRIQWGTFATSNIDDNETVTLPASFSNALYSVSVQPTSIPGDADIGVPWAVNSRGTASFTVNRDDNIDSFTTNLLWMAIGVKP